MFYVCENTRFVFSYIFVPHNLISYNMNQRAIAGISIDCTGPILVPDALTAAVNFVQTCEAKYARNPNSVPDLTAAIVVLTGSTPYTVYVFEVTTTMNNGTYYFTLSEVAPNTENL